MPAANAAKPHRPREWRCRVILPALVRSDDGWGNARILNISSRGILIQARVVWRDGARAGLATESCVPVEDILSLDQVGAMQLTAVERSPIDRRASVRRHADHRMRGRLFEFAVIAALSACVTRCAIAIVHDALAQPLARVRAALGD